MNDERSVTEDNHQPCVLHPVDRFWKKSISVYFLDWHNYLSNFEIYLYINNLATKKVLTMGKDWRKKTFKDLIQNLGLMKFDKIPNQYNKSCRKKWRNISYIWRNLKNVCKVEAIKENRISI